MARRKTVLRKGSWARDLVPPLTGGVMAAGTMLGIRMFVRPDTPAAARVYEWAPAIGAGVGAVLSGLLMYFLGGKGPASAAAGVSALVGVSQLGAERLLAADLTAGAAPSNGNGTTGLRAVMAQYGTPPGMRGPGTNAIVWEGVEGLQGNEQGQGEVVQLRGTVDDGAFGTRPY